jgi:hypothetical protein
MAASILCLVSAVTFEIWEVPHSNLVNSIRWIDEFHNYYYTLGTKNLSFLLTIVGLAGLVVTVSALSSGVELHTLMFAGILVPVGHLVVFNLGMVISLCALVSLALMGEAWRRVEQVEERGGGPPPYGVPEGWVPPAPENDTVSAGEVDMRPLRPEALCKVAAGLMLVGALVVLLMFDRQYPMEDALDRWQQWYVVASVPLGISGVVLIALKRAMPLVVITGVAVLASAFLDLYVVAKTEHLLYDQVPLTFLVSGTSALIAIVLVVTARDAFVPLRETLTFRSSPWPSWHRPRRPSP